MARIMVLRCPDAIDAPGFAAVTEAVESLSPKVEVLRPGLLALPARGLTAYTGGEETAAEALIDTVAEECGADCLVGVADTAFAAWLASIDGVIVAADATAKFLAEHGVAALGRPDLTDVLYRLGIDTLGGFADLPRAAVAERFGAEGVWCHRLASGEEARPLAPRTPPEDLSVHADYDPPIERVDAAAFAARTLAARLSAALAGHSLACSRLGIATTTADGRVRERLWHAYGAFTPDQVAQRIRWQ
ncbi:MAG TPA: hypothetical protein VE172_06505, partial [Stackebrandtia sp.]|uniref:DNA polymerase Y family protein n=1 Tax=Stackebrandtia sp. TaxID=2023065 RepID=UPI002D4A1F2E